MLTTLRDNSGNITASCEWWCVNDKGEWTPMGFYIWVNQLEHNPGIQGYALIRNLISEIAWTCPWAVGAYWDRRDKESNRIRGFKRILFIKYKAKEEVTSYGR